MRQLREVAEERNHFFTFFHDGDFTRISLRETQTNTKRRTLDSEQPTSVPWTEHLTTETVASDLQYDCATK